MSSAHVIQFSNELETAYAIETAGYKRDTRVLVSEKEYQRLLGLKLNIDLVDKANWTAEEKAQLKAQEAKASKKQQLEAAMRDAEQKAKAKKTKVDRINAEIEQFQQQQLRTAQAEVAAAKLACDQNAEQRTKLEGEIAELQQKLDEAKGDMENADFTALQQTQANLKAKQTERDGLPSAEDLQTALGDAEKARDEVDEQHEDLHTRLADVKREVAAADAELAELISKLDQLEEPAPVDDGSDDEDDLLGANGTTVTDDLNAASADGSTSKKSGKSEKGDKPKQKDTAQGDTKDTATASAGAADPASAEGTATVKKVTKICRGVTKEWCTNDDCTRWHLDQKDVGWVLTQAGRAVIKSATEDSAQS